MTTDDGRPAGDVVKLVPDNDDVSLPEGLVAKMWAGWKKHDLPKVDLARAMLCSAINVLIDEDGEHATAEFLAALALRMSPPPPAETKS